MAHRILKRNEEVWKRIFSIIIAIYCLVVIFLISVTFLASFKTKSDLVNNTLGIPKKITLDSYVTLIVKDYYLRNFFNSITITILSIISIIAISSLTAYGLSRYKFRFSEAVQTYFLLGLMFPIQLGILPIFIMLRSLNLTNNYLGMVLLYTANMSFPVFVFSMFFKTLPSSIHESAKIDGAGEFTIYFKIMLPLTKPVMATIALLSFINVWNDFFMPLVFLSKESMRTVTLGVYRYMSNFMANWHLVFAAASLSLIPIIIIFIFFSEKVISGITSGAVKQ